jgi:hypothetical protein
MRSMVSSTGIAPVIGCSGGPFIGLEALACTRNALGIDAETALHELGYDNAEQRRERAMHPRRAAPPSRSSD